MVQDPNTAVITYNQYDHEDGQGWPCHGKDNTSSDDVIEKKPKLSKDMISYIESCYFLELPIDSVCKIHIKKYLDIDATSRDRDFFLRRKDVVNIYDRLMKESYQLHSKDEMSVNLWYQRNQDDFFFFQKPNGTDIPFIAGIQTKWMLETMVKLSHNSLIAMDSTFSTNKYGVSFFSNDCFNKIIYVKINFISFKMTVSVVHACGL